MINFRESHKLQGSVLVIRGVGDSVFCIDNSFFVSQIDSHLKLQRSIQVSKDMQTPHRYSHAFGISPRAYFCIFGESKVFILGFEYPFL